MGRKRKPSRSWKRKKKKSRIYGREEEKEKEVVGESSNHQEQVSGDPAPPEAFKHEVFLSFCGGDTRLTFTDHLYNDLTDLRIRTFRDEENLHVGEEIGRSLMQAIEQSKILIPIFSKGYASSKWCLMELTHMVKCVEKNEGRTLICPIFYDVTPSEVKNQSGIFKGAFDGHVKKFDKKMVDEWKEALRKVPATKGWERAQIAGGHESELVKQVVTTVLLELKKKHKKVTEHLVGMDQHQAELMRLLDLDSNDVRIVGIVGMGGIGKTTIAKFIYNKLCDGFSQQCSFLEDVRESAEKSKGLDKLKKQLMADILKRTSKGMEMNRRTFEDTKALIVVDDVKDRKQLVKIIGECGWYGPGSRIIVTTRNKDTFRKEDGEEIYEPPEMSNDDALLLFCKYAFRQDGPREGYEDLSKEVVSKVAGLPLSLEVFGSLLSTKKKDVWDEIVESLEKLMQDEVQERLRISYDMLKKEHKDIFLDIACHFINSGKDKALAAKYMWKDCGFLPVSGIDTLVTLSLVKIDEYSRFWMHDQLRDLGREIVRKENPDNPGRRSRLWSPEVARDVLASKKGTKRVHTLYLGGERSVCHDLSEQVFRKLSCLRYLDLCDTYTFFAPYNLKGDFSGLLLNLRWLHWRVPSQITFTNLCLPKLVVLDLSQSEISDGWEEYIQIKVASNLKVLNLKGCENLTKTPDLSAFPKLERLNLEKCSNLAKISPSIKILKKLKYLNLNHCDKCCEEELPDGTSSKSKGKLPEFIWNLKSLEELHMKFVPITELSEDIGKLTNLTILNIGQTKIKKLPNDAFGKLEKLEELDASECRSLEELPESIGYLTNLRWLRISRSGIKRLPSTIGSQDKLQGLDVDCCKSLEELPESIGDLQHLRWLTIHFSGIKRLPSTIGSLDKLQRLDADYCKSLEELPESIGNLTNLQGLHLRSTAIKKLPAGIGMLRRLEVLDCDSCHSLEGEIPSGVWSIPALRVLSLRGTKISGLLPSYISCCSHLTILRVGGLRFPSSEEELRLPLGLKDVEIPLTRALLESVARLPELQSLAFYPCGDTDNLVEFPMDLGGLLHKIGGFRFLGFEKYASLPVGINNLLSLRTLSIGDDEFLSEEGTLFIRDDGYPSKEGWLKFDDENLLLERLPDLPNSLENICICNCPSLERLPDLPNSLKKISICYCPSLKRLPDLPNSLKKIQIYNCPYLEKLPDLPNSLEEIRICKCSSLKRLPDLPNSLEEIRICKCLSLERLPDLPNSLERIRICKCPSLKRLPDLPNSLKEIWISNCLSLESLPDFSALQRLETLLMGKYEKLHQIRALESLTSLKRVYLGDYPSSAELFDLSYLSLRDDFEWSLWSPQLSSSEEDMVQSSEEEDMVQSSEEDMVQLWSSEEDMVQLSSSGEDMEQLSLRNCPSLEKLSDLSHLKRQSRSVFEVHSCGPSLEKLPDLSRLKSELPDNFLTLNCEQEEEAS